MKNKIYIILAFALWSCNSDSKTEFKYDEAINNLIEDISKLPSSQTKTNLLRKSELILLNDTTYKQNLSESTFDDIKSKIVWDDYLSHLKRQLDISKIEDILPSDRIEAYKFSYQRSFSDELVFITIYTQDGQNPKIKGQVVEKDSRCNPMVGDKELSGSCFTVKFNNTIDVSKSEWDDFIQLINETNFWQLKPIDYSQSVILDGSDWYFSSIKPINSDSIISKEILEISPNESKPLFKIGNTLLNMVDYDFGEIY